MIPFNPEAVHVMWFNVWRNRVAQAKLHQGDAMYCRAAALAQALYAQTAAIEVVKERSKYL